MGRYRYGSRQRGYASRSIYTGPTLAKVCCVDCRMRWPIKGEHVCESDDLAHARMNREVEARFRARRAA